MKPTRREMFKICGAAGAALAGCSNQPESADEQETHMGVLVDTSLCIGCRRCEYACQSTNEFDPPGLESFSDTSVFREERRPRADSYTVVNPIDSGTRVPQYVKLNCMHCVDPACVSACLVSAMTKRPDGPVVYDASRCMGCRYCMVACPFEMPAYDYHNPLTPQVRKCTLCADRVPELQTVPACVHICPAEALTYGPRQELLAVAHERIAAHSDRYVDHIYGEHEVGGTSWLYLASAPVEKLGFWKLPETPPGKLTESVQHGVFKGFGPPLMIYGLLMLIARMARSTPDKGQEP